MKRALTFLIATVVACSSTKSTSVNLIAYTGTYDLVSIDGVLLPAGAGDDGGNHYVALSGNTILRVDGSFTKNHLIATYNSANVQTETIPYVYNGNYEIVGTRISFNYPANATEAAHSVVGDIDGGVIVQTSVAKSWRFVRK
jgi:hypothetical protein